MGPRLVIRLFLLIGVFGIAFMSMLGYTFDNLLLARWTTGNTVPMALNTALCFIFLAVERLLEITNGGWGSFRPVRD